MHRRTHPSVLSCRRGGTLRGHGMQPRHRQAVGRSWTKPSHVRRTRRSTSTHRIPTLRPSLDHDQLRSNLVPVRCGDPSGTAPARRTFSRRVRLGLPSDGSWCVSAGLDAVVWVWDLHTGRHIHTFTRHVKPILAVDVAKDGYTVVTAGEDHTCKLWDLQQRRCIYTLPAHASLISTACFETKQGGILLTGSYDGTLRLWSTSTHACLNTLEAHEGKAAAGAVGEEAALIFSAGFDKSLKRWCVDTEGEWPKVS